MSKEIEFAAGVTMDASGLFDWINRATPYLKSELWRLSDCLAMPSTPTGLGENWDKELDKKLEADHKELTALLTQVGALDMTKEERIEAFNGSERASYLDLQIELLGMDYYLCQGYHEADRVFTLFDIQKLMLTLTEAKEIMEAV